LALLDCVYFLGSSVEIAKPDKYYIVRDLRKIINTFQFTWI